MVRCSLGYTPLLKAAALNRTKMVKTLIEMGVDPKHMDPYGNTPREKAELYQHDELVIYLEQQELLKKRGELLVKDFSTFSRSGKLRCRLDY